MRSSVPASVRSIPAGNRPDQVGTAVGSTSPDVQFLRQWGYQIVNGRKITVSLVGLPPTCGYIAGIYNDCLQMIIPDLPDPISGESFTRRFINRSLIAYMDFHGKSTYADEPLHDKFEETIAGLREYMERNILHSPGQGGSRKRMNNGRH